MSLMNKTLKELWDALSLEDRAKYEELGKKDKARYNAETKELKERGTFTPLGLNRKLKSLHGESVPKKTMNDQMIKLENAQAVTKTGSDMEREENLQPGASDSNIKVEYYFVIISCVLFLKKCVYICVL